jgi:allophanate hydrolase
MKCPTFPRLDFTTVRRDFADPVDLLHEIDRRIQQRGEDGVWIHRPSLGELLASVPTDRGLPLFGLPFAVKDNIDVAGWPTTAGCPEFAYTAKEDAAVVARLRQLGAIPVGKTNLDQFATGLVGTRSPYGIPRSVFHDEYLSGGSSSGSAVAVAAGAASFALGTDTAGSGRVPAAFNALVGLKPTRGLVSTRGVVPACRSLDCVSVFSVNVADAHEVFAKICAFDSEDPYSRKAPCSSLFPATPRIGVPRQDQLSFSGDAGMRKIYADARIRCEKLGWEIVEIDLTPFSDAAALLYSGPWVAERFAAVGEFLLNHPDAGHPVVRRIIEKGARFSAFDAFRGEYELARLRRLADREWERMDAMLLPTTPTIFRVDEVLAEPVQLNSTLGTYTNFVNLLDLAALAVPAGFRADGLPLGVTFMAPAFGDDFLSVLGSEFLGESRPALRQEYVDVSVVGAHLSGQPLNHQLTSRGARLLKTCRTAANYRLFALANTTPPKPGLVRTPGFSALGIETEVWRLTPRAFGEFVAEVPAPMGIGTVTLDDGSEVKGFLCEVAALDGAQDITEFGGWRAFRRSALPPP